MTANEIFALLLVAGSLMVGAEVFIPGGVLGIIGGILLTIAVILAFSQSVTFGVLAMVGVVVLVAVMMALWIRFFPHTWVGRRMTVGNSLAGADSGGHYAGLIGKEGLTTSGLRPGGYAELDGSRVDVVTDGEWIEAGMRIRVLDVRGNRVIVQKAVAGTQESATD